MKKGIRLPATLLVIGICASMAVGAVMGALGVTRSQTVQALLDPDIQVVYNGETQTLTNANGAVVVPLMFQGSTYLPVRAVAGIFGEAVDWDAATKSVILGTPVAVASQEQSMAQEVLRLVNEQRAAQGLAALAVHTQLEEAAYKRTLEIVQSFSHIRPNGASCFTILDETGIVYRSAGENIAAGQTSAAGVMDAWMNSEGHRKNILQSSYTHLGVSCYRDNTGRLHWVQLFIGVN